MIPSRRLVQIGIGFLMVMETAFCQQPVPSGLACIADMRIPVFSKLVWTGSSQGLSTVRVSVGPGGAPTAVDVKSPSPTMTAWLKSWAQGIRFQERCVGSDQEIKLVYRFDGEPTGAIDSQVQIRDGNTFEITARPPPIVY